MNLTDQQRARMEELLADQAVFGLDDVESQELQTLLGETDGPLQHEFDDLAANLLLADVNTIAQPPAALAQQVIATAEIPSPPPAADSSVTDSPAAQSTLSVNPRRSEAMAWFVTACMVVITVFTVNRNSQKTEPAPPTLAEIREEFLATDSDSILVDWLPGTDSSALNATGDIVWNAEQQSGVMRFRGLQPNDPTVEQYQLWIIDGSRNAAQPVDGGVFDIPPGDGDVLVQIAAKLKVDQPLAFAVTVEKPGGVVVSDRERLALLASVDAG